MADIFALLAEPWQHAFMVRALLATAMVGVVCSVLGAYVVLRGMAFFGDALAHSILPGVVLAFVWWFLLAVWGCYLLLLYPLYTRWPAHEYAK